jgi:hypothetical protein
MILIDLLIVLLSIKFLEGFNFLLKTVELLMKPSILMFKSLLIAVFDLSLDLELFH